MAIGAFDPVAESKTAFGRGVIEIAVGVISHFHSGKDLERIQVENGNGTVVSIGDETAANVFSRCTAAYIHHRQGFWFRKVDVRRNDFAVDL